MRKQKTPNQKKNFLKRIQKYEDNVRSLWDNFKPTNVQIFWVPEEEREQDTENLLEEIMTENFPYLVKEIDLKFRKCTEPQTKGIQRGPHQGIP